MLNKLNLSLYKIHLKHLEIYKYTHLTKLSKNYIPRWQKYLFKVGHMHITTKL